MLTLFLFVTLIIPERKAFFIVSILFLFGLFYALRDWSRVLFFGYFVLNMFPVGQVYRFVLLSEEELFFNARFPFGREAFFLLSPAFIVGLLLMARVIQLVFLHNHRRVMTAETGLIGLCILLKFLSAVFAQNTMILSLLWSIGLVELYSWLLLHFLIKPMADDVKKKLIYTLLALVLFQGAGVLAQWVRQQPIGILIEGARSEAAQEISVDYFRPRGYFSHPNAMAKEMMGLMMILFVSLIGIKKIVQKRSVITGIIVAVISIFLSQSRAGILSLGLAVAPWSLWLIHTRWAHVVASLRRKISISASIVILVLVSVVSIVFVSRAVNTILFSMGEGGGFDVRNQLIQEAMVIIKENPVFGVGYGMFVPAAFERNITGVLEWYPQAVHNGFLLMASESGILVLALTIVVVVMLIKGVFVGKFSFETKLALLGFFVGQIVFMFFHPVDNIISMNTIVVVILIHDYEI